MIIRYTRLMYPEPEDTGSGESAPANTEDTQDTANTEPKQETATDPFAAALQGGDEDEAEEPEETQENAEDDVFDWTDLDYTDDDKKLLDEVCSQEGISKARMSKALRRIQAATAEDDKEQSKLASEALQKAWGAKFKDRVSKTGAFMSRFAKQAGWDEAKLKTFATPDGYSLFYDIMRITGESRVRNGAQVQKEKPETLESVRAKIRSAEDAWYAAKHDNNKTKMKEASDMHVELLTMQKKFLGTYDGHKAPRVFSY